MQAEKDQLVAQTHQVQSMFDNGVIKEDDQGNFVPVMDPAESEHLRRQNTASK